MAQTISDSDSGRADSEWFLLGVVCVPSDEILEQQFWVCEIRGIILERLSVASHEGLLEISGEPNPLLHLFTSQEGFSFLNQLISSHLHVLVEEVASEDLLSVLEVKHIRHKEEQAQSDFSCELQVLIVEENVVVVKEQEGATSQEHQILFIVWVVDVEIGHVIIPLSCKC